MTTKIYGLGWVGKSMLELFPESLVHDPAQDLIDKHSAQIGFVCVPTNLLANGRLDTSIVEEVVANSQEDLLVIRSTLNPGTCDKLANKYNKRIVMQPEYLGETPSHPMLNASVRQFMVIGGSPADRQQLIELYTSVYNANVSITQVTNYEAEVIKLTENRAIGFKVMQLHELYKVCEKAELDYYTIRDAVYGADPRFNLWFSFVYPDNMGFNSSKCLKKDIPAWNAWAESVGFNPVLTRTLVAESAIYAKP